MRDPAEVGLTNLGPVPSGMGFYEAVLATRGLRKFAINPHHESRRLTVCETLREIWREAAKPAPDMERIQELVAAAFDMGKRMNARMTELKCSRS